MNSKSVLNRIMTLLSLDEKETLFVDAKLADFATLSTGSTGDLAMSGSQLYFYTGGTWRQVSLV